MKQDDMPAQCWYLEIDVALSERAQAALAECLVGARYRLRSASTDCGGLLSDGSTVFGGDSRAICVDTVAREAAG